MTIPFKVVAGSCEQQVPPLRCAPVGMTLLLSIRNLQKNERVGRRPITTRSGWNFCCLFEGLNCSLTQELFGSLDEASVGGYG